MTVPATRIAPNICVTWLPEVDGCTSISESLGPSRPLGFNSTFLSKPCPSTAPIAPPIGPPSAVPIAVSTRVAINHPPHPDHWPGAFPRHSHHTPQPRMRMDEPLAGKDHHMKQIGRAHV